MRLVLGAAMPSEGEIELFGGEELSRARHRIGALLEYPCIYKNCTAYENLKRFSLLTGNSRDDLTEILDMVGLKGVGKKKAGKFSLGMKQRLAIGIALLGDPEEFFNMTMTTPWFYSALYNGSYMLVDMVLCLVIGALLWKPLGKYLRGEDLKV